MYLLNILFLSSYSLKNRLVIKSDFYNNSTNSRAPIAWFLSSISVLTHEFIIYAMRQRARADIRQFVIVKTNWGQFFIRLSCYWQWISSYTIVKVVCGSTRLLITVCKQTFTSYKPVTWKVVININNRLPLNLLSITRHTIWKYLKSANIINSCMLIPLNI